MKERPKFIIWHCSASPYGCVDTIRAWHQARGWDTIGYHGVILNGYITEEDVKKERRDTYLDGLFQVGRVMDNDQALEKTEYGAHVYGLNRHSIGLCLIGRGSEDFTEQQIMAALFWTRHFQAKFGIADRHVIGHYEVGEFIPEYSTTKRCPGIDMETIRKIINAGAELYAYPMESFIPQEDDRDYNLTAGDPRK